MSGVIGFPGATAVGRGGGLAAGVVGASVAEGTGHSPPLPLPPGYLGL